MKVALWGTFDVNNYGDLLFPVIAKNRYPNIEWYFISPTNNKTLFKDSLDVINVEEAEKIEFDGVIIGGGNIINTKPTTLNAYDGVGSLAYPKLWIGAAQVAIRQKVNFSFNAPGISHLTATIIDKLLYKHVLKSSSYISFREKTSVEYAKNFTSNKIIWVPDTAIEISKIWPLGGATKKKSVIFNLNKRYHSPADKTAEWIDKISSKLDLKIKFVIIGVCHGDVTFTNEVKKYLTNSCEIVRTETLKDLALTIGRSSFFIGSSMHGFITALSYNTPALLKLDERPMEKFCSIVSICGLNPEVICSSWEVIYANLAKPAVVSSECKRDLFSRLDLHWDEMVESLKGEKRCSRSLLLIFWRQVIIFDRIRIKLYAGIGRRFKRVRSLFRRK